MRRTAPPSRRFPGGPMLEQLGVALGVAAVSGVVLQLVPNQFVFLHFFYLPVAYAAWRLGLLHALFTSAMSVGIVFVTCAINPAQFSTVGDPFSRWLDLGLWGAFLFVTGYAVGLLAERDQTRRQQLEAAYRGVVEIMARFIDAVDRSTENHSRRVAERAVELARELAMPDGEIETLRVAAYLHDIGKVEVSTDVLQKASQLSPSETEVMRRHVDHGVDLLQRVGGLLEHVVPIVLYHHERWDGRGYKGLRGEEIPLGARIIAVADTYDAIVDDRPYRRGRSHTQAIEVLRAESGTQFDPAVVEAFIRLYDAGTPAAESAAA